MESRINKLIVILGPTASGKTEYSVMLAKRFDTEIISADSRQFYHELSIGTAKPAPEQLAAVRHYFIGHISIHEQYDIAMYEKEALELLNSLFEQHKAVVMVGGSGLYIDAVCKGIDVMPGHDTEIRLELELALKNKGIEYLRNELKKLDPDYYLLVDLDNPVRLIRAIEVCHLSGKPYSSFRKGKSVKRNFNIIKIGLNIPRGLLIDRINRRVEQMMDSGLLDEVRKLMPYRHLNALNTLGYKELFSYMDGIITLDRAIEEIKVNTRKYAKRQMTWFRKDPEIIWVDPGQWGKVQEQISQLCGL